MADWTQGTDEGGRSGWFSSDPDSGQVLYSQTNPNQQPLDPFTQSLQDILGINPTNAGQIASVLQANGGASVYTPDLLNQVAQQQRSQFGGFSMEDPYNILAKLGAATPGQQDDQAFQQWAQTPEGQKARQDISDNRASFNEPSNDWMALLPMAAPFAVGALATLGTGAAAAPTVAGSTGAASSGLGATLGSGAASTGLSMGGGTGLSLGGGGLGLTAGSAGAGSALGGAGMGLLDGVDFGSLFSGLSTGGITGLTTGAGAGLTGLGDLAAGGLGAGLTTGGLGLSATGGSGLSSLAQLINGGLGAGLDTGGLGLTAGGVSAGTASGTSFLSSIGDMLKKIGIDPTKIGSTALQNLLKGTPLAGLAGGSGTGTTGSYSPDLGGIVGSLLGYSNQKDYQNNLIDVMNKAVDRADPFYSQRPQYQAELNKMYTDPNYFSNNAVLKGMNQNIMSDTSREMAAQGYNYSTNVPNQIAQRLQNNDMPYAMQMLQTTGNFAGANINPAPAGQIAAATGTNAAQAGAANGYNLNSLFNTVNQGVQPTAGQQQQTGQGTNQTLLQSLLG